MKSDKKCAYKLSSEKDFECLHPTYKNEEFCVFHSPNVKEKERDFKVTLNNYIKECEENKSIKFYDFRGVIFPKISFANKEFVKNASFKESQFSGDADFSSSQFSGYADFISSQFSGYADFMSSQFSGNAYFSSIQFSGYADFSSSQFSGYADFSSSQFSGDVDFILSQFSGNAYFSSSQFSGYAYFSSSQFSGYAYFRESQFSGYADFTNSKFDKVAFFSEAKFLKRTEFFQAIFNDEIEMNNSHFVFIKNLKSKGINFQNTVLESAHLWGINEIQDYSFKNSFLLSISFANKKFINCDFTGALFDAVHTRGWEPDEKTLKNTKYIFTNYSKDEDGNLTVDPESRVPADGNFGEGEHKDFTIADYLREPIKWSFSLNLPFRLRTAVRNYIQFFTDCVKVTDGIDVEIITKQEGEKIRVEFLANSNEDKIRLQERFGQHIENAQKRAEDLSLEIRNPEIKDRDKDLLLIEYKGQINQLQTKLEYEQKFALQEKEHSQTLKGILENVESSKRKELPSTSSEQNIFALFADLAGFSKATAEDESIHTTIQDFFLKQIDEIEPKEGIEEVKSNGDDIITFGLDGMSLVWVAEDLINDFQKLKRDFREFPIKGFRVVLGYGTCNRQKVGDKISFSGNPIIDTARVDQPMKKYIQENNEDLNQIWCTEDFKNEMTRRGEKRISFKELPEMDLAKGYEKKFKLFKVEVN